MQSYHYMRSFHYYGQDDGADAEVLWFLAYLFDCPATSVALLVFFFVLLYVCILIWILVTKKIANLFESLSLFFLHLLLNPSDC